MIHILLVEDEENLVQTLAFNLRNVGYDVTIATTAPEATERLSAGESFDLIVLDLQLPGGDGVDIAKGVRRAGDFTPILVLTARILSEEETKALDAGADDYLTKPFDLDVLLARIRVLLRRQAWGRARDREETIQSGLLEFGDCHVDFRTLKAIGTDGEEILLSRKEAMLLRLLAEEEGEPVTRARLLEEVWGAPGDLTTRTVDNFVLRLRRYFETNSSEPEHILTVRGVGYRFVKGE